MLEYLRQFWDYRFAVGFVLGGAVLGLIAWNIPNPSEIQRYRGATLRESTAMYQYIDPLLACEVGTESAFPELGPIKSAAQAVIDNKIDEGKAKNISVYFRTLNGSKWFEINGNVPYEPASLLKVFVMMAYFKEADETDNPGLLQRQVAFEGSKNPSEDTPGEIIPHLKNGAYYSIEQLIEQMIVYSDNDALNTLVDNFSPHTVNYFELIFKDLNIPSPVTQSEDTLAFMTPDAYSMVFRVLYSSTYLSERYSEKALFVLSKAHYREGLVAGVPSSVTVVHKFGIATIPASGNTPALRELHDCGIVYYSDRPYLLCVMTQGDDFGALQQDIKEVSSAVYGAFDTYVKNTSTKK